jgi:hypothetical protein
MILEADALPSTEDGSNWTVAVFRCPRKNWTETLRSLFSELDKQKLALIPHYTTRAFEASTDSFIVSFRAVRKQEHEEPVKSLIDRLLKGYDHEIDPKAGSPFSEHHQWIRHRQVEPEWNRQKCQTLSRISRAVLESIDSNTTAEQRYQWLHLFANMSVIFQIDERYWTAETYPRECRATH